MNALMYSLLTFYAQTAAGTPAPGATPAAGDTAAAAAAAVPAAPDAAALEAAKAAGQAAQLEAATEGAADMTVMSLWSKLNEVEKGVVLILGILTVFAIMQLVEKVWVLRTASAQSKEFLAAFRKANSVEEAEAIVRKLPQSGLRRMFDAGLAEVRRTQDLGLYTMRDARDHTMQRVPAAAVSKQNEYLEEIGSNMTMLASIGSNAPFIGLFGTVWGIMVAFIGIANTQTTSLAVVAPGIAGALLATAAGLAAAIPAVLIYNFAAKSIAKHGGKMDDFLSEFIALVSRDMDRRAG
jgi:biopolymer transport protein ExbB/TolQ